MSHLQIILAAVTAMAVLSACGDRCEKLQSDMDELQREAIRNPLRLPEEAFRGEIADVLEELDEHNCGR